jgi:hypothetical protein
LILKGERLTCDVRIQVFFFTYAAFEVPSNLLLKKLRPSIWLPTIMVAWGIVMTLMGIVQSYEGLLVARIFLGVTEAGYVLHFPFLNVLYISSHEGREYDGVLNIKSN